MDADKIFKKKLNKSTHNTRNQNTRHFIKKTKFYDSLLPRGKCPACGNFVKFAIKRTVSKFK